MDIQSQILNAQRKNGRRRPGPDASSTNSQPSKMCFGSQSDMSSRAPHRAIKFEGSEPAIPIQPNAEDIKPFKQLDVPQIQPDQLIREAKSIYAAMLMVENKCNEVDRQEDAKVRSGDIQHIPAARYKELVVLHRTLLYEQYDFFLACSHPAATPELRSLPYKGKYGLPERIWKSGIHSFLGVLRHHLPDSLEDMRTFLHMAYGVVCLLYETIPSHKATWIGYLRNLSRYRTIVKEYGGSVDDVWTFKAREIFFATRLASQPEPDRERLYRHFANIALRSPVNDLHNYLKTVGIRCRHKPKGRFTSSFSLRL
ncbi:hypothetical protein BJ508DRAFT_164207 [Ascobolus immersus RN42]|uniref:DNA/RNA-binding domain-containing protein n=1 Tax=Ascobolus immersus RN42 TaxID=1160509 RepID=A0A3N4HV68_ASCIM|nr:hypothetical protein BJ508DRAFT_164207 [Ascobolus immersus RN42]